MKALDVVLSYARRHGLVRDGQRVLLGLGGGVASAGMLAAMVMAREARLLRVEIGVAAVESVLDELDEGAEVVAEVGRVARSFGLPFFAVRPAMGRGRVRILDELRRVAVDQGFDRVAIATTRDDEVRRVLRGLGRGSGLGAISGYAPRLRGGVIRPMLPLREVEAAALARDLGVEPVQLPPPGRAQPSRVEELVLPRWRSVEPGIDDSLLRLAAEVRAIRGMLRREAQAWIDASAHGAGRYSFVVMRSEPPRGPLVGAVCALLVKRLAPAALASRSACERRLARLFRAPRGSGRGRATPTVMLPGLQAEVVLTEERLVVRVSATHRGVAHRASG